MRTTNGSNRGGFGMGWILKHQKLLRELEELSGTSAKHISLRLPLLTAAKISALCEIYPAKTRTDVIITLLENSLDEFVNIIAEDKENSDLKETFEQLVNKYVELYGKDVLPGKALKPPKE
ncbi:hypothetical protein EPN95_04770 [Patescibacteria group bacterium]|nr:MAG: hypothetical protein EPN95_04770 [Patescibacteria group bacterium]